MKWLKNMKAVHDFYVTEVIKLKHINNSISYPYKNSGRVFLFDTGVTKIYCEHVVYTKVL